MKSGLVYLRGMTKLAAIPAHTIWLECSCGHAAGVKVAEIDRPELTVQEVADSARCTRWHAYGAVCKMITFEGGSFDAIQGARGIGDLAGFRRPKVLALRDVTH